MLNINLNLTKEAMPFFKKNGVKIRYKKGQLFVRPEDSSQGIYYLISGQAMLDYIKEDGTEHIIGFWEDGGIFGKIGSVIAQPHTNVYIQALTDCVVYRITCAKFKNFLAINKSVAQAYMQQISLNNVFALNQIMVLGEKNSYQRVVSQLILLAKFYGEKNGHACTIKIILSQEQLANMVCITREYLSKTLKKIKEKKLIKVNKTGQIVVLNLKTLQQEIKYK